MSHPLLLSLLGTSLVALGFAERGWLLVAVWLGTNFLILGLAHFLGAHHLYGKGRNGKLAIWAWIIFFPLLVYTHGVWHLLRILSREPAQSVVNDRLVIGRRLLGGEALGEFDQVIDLTAEFSEPMAIRNVPGYCSIPVLDAAAPSLEVLRTAVANLGPGRTFIHCAQGHGRTGLFAAAVLLKSGCAGSVEDSLRMLKSVRRTIRLNKKQRQCLEAYAASLVGR